MYSSRLIVIHTCYYWAVRHTSFFWDCSQNRSISPFSTFLKLDLLWEGLMTISLLVSPACITRFVLINLDSSWTPKYTLSKLIQIQVNGGMNTFSQTIDKNWATYKKIVQYQNHLLYSSVGIGKGFANAM